MKGAMLPVRREPYLARTGRRRSPHLGAADRIHAAADPVAAGRARAPPAVMRRAPARCTSSSERRHRPSPARARDRPTRDRRGRGTRGATGCPSRTPARPRGDRRPLPGTIRARAGSARTCRSSCTAGREGSSLPSSRVSGRVSVAPSSGCADADNDPSSQPPGCRAAAARLPRRAEPPARARPRLPWSGTRSCATIGPVSRPSSIRISVTPVSVSPARIAAGIGDAPRCRGSSDGCTLSAPCGGSASQTPARAGRSRPGRAAAGSARGPARAPRGPEAGEA